MTQDSEKIAGYVVEIAIRTGAVATTRITKAWKGTEANARRKARLISCYDHIITIEPVKASDWNYRT